VALFFALILGVIAASLVILFVGALTRVSPGDPFVAVLLGGGLLAFGLAALRGVARLRGPEKRTGPEDVGELDVYFVCGECGTELHVERIGELQVPRHCGERMRVERRARPAPGARA
jgi:hypothetical protein